MCFGTQHVHVNAKACDYQRFLWGWSYRQLQTTHWGTICLAVLGRIGMFQVPWREVSSINKMEIDKGENRCQLWASLYTSKYTCVYSHYICVMCVCV